MHISQVNAELGGQRAGSELGKCEPFAVFFFGDPLPLLYEVAVHVADQGDGTTKAEGAEFEKVPGECCKAVCMYAGVVGNVHH